MRGPAKATPVSRLPRARSCIVATTVVGTWKCSSWRWSLWGTRKCRKLRLLVAIDSLLLVALACLLSLSTPVVCHKHATNESNRLWLSTVKLQREEGGDVVEIRKIERVRGTWVHSSSITLACTLTNGFCASLSSPSSSHFTLHQYCTHRSSLESRKNYDQSINR